MQTFLCDEMLTGLGHWLRIAGYDTLIVEPGTPDKEVAQRVLSEARFFLTCDTRLAEQLINKANVLQLSDSHIDHCVHELNEHLQLNWTDKAFTRCSVCNNPIRIATADEELTNNLTFKPDGPVYFCCECEKLYWEGSHVKRMRKKLDQFNQL